MVYLRVLQGFHREKIKTVSIGNDNPDVLCYFPCVCFYSGYMGASVNEIMVVIRFFLVLISGCILIFTLNYFNFVKEIVVVVTIQGMGNLWLESPLGMRMFSVIIQVLNFT